MAKSLPTTQGAAKYLRNPKVVVDHVAEQVRQSELAHACLVALNNTRKRCEEFGSRHPQAKEYFEKAVMVGGYFVDAVAIISSWAGGPATGIPVTGMVLASRSEAGEAVANGVLDVLSNAAAACAKTDQEKQEFADTARFCVQVCSSVSATKSSFHVASKLKTTVLSYKTLGLEKGYNWLDFGCKFEDHLATTKYASGDRLPPYFKTFDFFDKENGIATSVKTLDTRTDSLRAKPKDIGVRMRGYIKDISDFEEYKLSGTLVTKDMIKVRKLELGIPTDTTPIQRQHILKAIEHGKNKGVEVIITEIEY
ncbi:MAG: hypothetical protein LBJ75_02830 [Puniceicoccales bacterium]|nr:hypothetical protein [Puniceicoccales bacterium]